MESLDFEMLDIDKKNKCRWFDTCDINSLWIIEWNTGIVTGIKLSMTSRNNEESSLECGRSDASEDRNMLMKKIKKWKEENAAVNEKYMELYLQNEVKTIPRKRKRRE